MVNIPIAADVFSLAETHRYHKTAFLFPAWKEIYTMPSESRIGKKLKRP